MDGASLGVYPVYVTAGTKKVLVLSVTRAALAETLSGFSEDVSILRESLYKEHKAIMDGLKMPDIPDSPMAVADRVRKQAADDKKVTVEDSMLDRVRALETTVQDTMDAMSSVQSNMEYLPKILKLVQKNAENPEAMKRLTAAQDA